ncbi:LysR family transcriptional regulator [Pseudogemmobacter sp. W21_MBD1_M6]|uniref:LysR family transcriptional regulator n=1 Tax=Pseudogemmobacter sp. W21_MBD1_M6 TaxID=3240271 RepID=UPI003F9D867B
MENWDDYRIVMALARFGSMSDAARNIGTNVTTVSRRIQRLSEGTNEQIVTRTKTGWALTGHGAALVELAEEFDSRLAELNAGVLQEDTALRRISISTIEFLMHECLIPFLPLFQETCPNVELDIITSDKTVSLAYGEADLSVRLGRPTEGRLIGKQIGEVPIGFFRNEGSTNPDWVGLPRELDWTAEMQAAEAFFGRPPKIRLQTFQAIVSAADITGLGCVAPGFQVPEGANLRPLLGAQGEGQCSVTREIWLVFHETRRKDPTLRRVADWIEHCFKSMHLSGR